MNPISPYPVSAHMIVKNEERFVGYAILAVLPYVEEFIFYDTGSTDDTLEIVRKLKTQNPKIKLKTISIHSPNDIGSLRLQQIKETKTPWFLLVDGDEVWPAGELEKLLQFTIGDQTVDCLHEPPYAMVNHTRNCVGDIYHYLPESFGHYHLLGRTGHYNIRLMKTLNYEVKGTYPDEGYYYQGKLINEKDDWLAFSEAWYLHATHLERSGRGVQLNAITLGRRKRIYSLGIPFNSSELPEVIFQDDKTLPDITNKRSLGFVVKAILADLVRRFR